MARKHAALQSVVRGFYDRTMSDPAGVRSLGAGDRDVLWPLYEAQPTLRAVTRSVLEGRLGAAWADDPARPRVARLDIGCYALFGGDPHAPAAGGLARSVVAPRELVFGNDAGWRAMLAELHGGAVHDRPMRDFDAGALDRERLAAIAAVVPSGFAIARIDEVLARQLDGELEPNALQVYASAAQFARDGLGYGALRDGRLMCAATTYTLSSRDLELAIATRPAARGRGLAAAVSAKLMAHALAEGLLPHWNASNPISQRLARRLGYRDGGVCEVLYLS